MLIYCLCGKSLNEAQCDQLSVSGNATSADMQAKHPFAAREA